MGCIALVRCVLVLRWDLAVVVWYPYAGWSTASAMLRWVPNATNTLSVYATFIVCPLQQRLHERALMLRRTYITCLLTTHFHLICSSVLLYFLLQSIVNTHQYQLDRHVALQLRPRHIGEKRCSYTHRSKYRPWIQDSGHGAQTINSTWSEALSRHGRFRVETLICCCQIWIYNSSGHLTYSTVTVSPELYQLLIVI